MEIEIYKMTFKIQKEMKILRILGEDFQENNRNKGKLVINNKKYTLQNVIPYPGQGKERFVYVYPLFFMEEGS